MSNGPRKSTVVRKFRSSGTVVQQHTKSLQESNYETLSYVSDKRRFTLSCFDRHRGMYSPEDLHDRVLKLHKYCLTHLLDSYRVHLNRLKGIKVLNELVSKTYFDDLKISQVVRIVWCSISIVHHFHIRLRVGKGFTVWNRRRQAELADLSFDRVMMLLLPDLFSTIIHSIITFFEEARLWDTELLCSDLLKRILTFSNEYEKCLQVLLDVAEASQPQCARKVIRVVYDIVEGYRCDKIDEELTDRFLLMYRYSILPGENCDFSHLKKGLEVCIRRLLNNMSNEDLLLVIGNMLTWTLSHEISDEALLDFGNVLEYACMLHRSKLYKFSLTDTILTHAMMLISSDNLLNSLLGHRMLQHLLDRHNNKSQFDIARIFFQHTHFNITVGEYFSEDKALLKSNRELIHSNILASVQKHGKHRISLESAYSTLAMLVLEVPCGYTASTMTCLAMSIQEATIADDSLELDSSNRIHASVMSIMSLVCWVHNAEIFYDYLNTILQRRAEYAPHLNPPLQTSYKYARHHILWNKPELFFEDWEVRYGLWKCFKARGVGQPVSGRTLHASGVGVSTEDAKSLSIMEPFSEEHSEHQRKGLRRKDTLSNNKETIVAM